VDEADVFQRMNSFDDGWLAEVFAREVLRFLVGREILSPEWAERLLSWRHTGFSAHSRVRAINKPEAERDICSGEAAAITGLRASRLDGGRGDGVNHRETGFPFWITIKVASN
jgi:hypothetical protein